MDVGWDRARHANSMTSTLRCGRYFSLVATEALLFGAIMPKALLMRLHHYLVPRLRNFVSNFDPLSPAPSKAIYCGFLEDSARSVNAAFTERSVCSHDTYS